MTPAPDPVELMLRIASHFMDRASELDGRVEAAVEAGASAPDIKLLMDLAATDRLRALSAAQAAAPFVRPRLQAVEISPVSEPTRSRFDERLAKMSEDEVVDHLRRVAAGTATVGSICTRVLLEGNDVEVEMSDDVDL